MKTRICIFGGSISQGHFDHEQGGWVERLKRELKDPNETLRIFNLGISGDSTQEILKRMKVEAKARKSNVIIYAGGTNDSRYLKGNENNTFTKPKQFQKNLKKILKISRKLNAKLLFINACPCDDSKTQPVPWNPEHSYSNKNINKYNEMTKNFAEENNLPLIDINSKITSAELVDGLHPNSQGHEKIFQTVKSKLQELKII